ncbi:MAG TPA: ABC transporter ATP-binding protein [Thioploca sp.]|nr:MAG: ABC transporter ATP-binding protein [Gammaproteobacteria bacterium]HDN27491.1 ABC transporter ATP-binding protein [Thioploca sp.]
MNTNQFNRISIKGYRRLGSVDIQMRPLTVMIGANGVGKTAFLEVFSLLAASANGQLASQISELGGMSDILTRDKAKSLGFELSMRVSEHESLDYTLQIEAKGHAYEIVAETLKQNHDNFKYIERHQFKVSAYDNAHKPFTDWESTPFETILSQMPKARVPANLGKKMASASHYSAYILNVAQKSPIRLPQAMRPVNLPGKNGEDLVSYLYYLRETEPYRFEMVEDSLACAFPNFKGLSFPPVAAGTLALTWHEFSTPLYMHQLSEGTLRFLWLITLLQSPHLTAITLIDEPEVSLHPQLLSLLSGLMREASKRTQLIVATHSDRLIGFLEPHEVLVMDEDEEEGLTQMTWADELDLEHWLSDYTLDQVWRTHPN